MRRKLLPLAIATVLACITAATAHAAESTTVNHFSSTFPGSLCGFTGTVAVRGMSVFRDTGNGTYFENSTFTGVFTADNGRSTKISYAGPVKQASPPAIDDQAGTVTITTTYEWLFIKLGIDHGPTLSVDAGPATFVDVYTYTGDPNDPVGDFISETLAGLHGPHPDLLSGFSLECDVLGPYLQSP